MKFVISKNLKKTLLIITSVILFLSIFLLILSITNPGQRQEKQSQYKYSQQAQVNYNVFLSPNSIYSVTSIGEGKTYITSYVDHINTTFNYAFNGDRKADIKGKYSISAVVSAGVVSDPGIMGAAGKEKATKKTIWSKEFLLQPATSFTSSSGSISVKKDLALVLKNYIQFANKIAEETKIPADTSLIISWNVLVEADTDKGVVKQQAAPTMEIPLGSSYFEVGGKLVDNKTGAIEKTIDVKLPINSLRIIIFSICAFICLCSIGFLLLFTTGAEVGHFEKKVKKIFKNLGSRLVRVNKSTGGNYDDEIEVKSIEDLVRVADEIGKPVMYKFDDTCDKKYTFFVLEAAKLFYYELSIDLETDCAKKYKGRRLSINKEETV